MTTTDKSRADALTDLSDDELALIREEAARITDDWCERQFMEPSQKESDAKFVREVLRLAASPSSQPAAAPADLQGLRRSILTSREIVRDQDGMLSHPAVPYLDEDVNYETFFAAFGIEATFIHMEDDVDCDTYDRYFASNSPDCCTWTPSSPQGDGWMLLEIYDTEDGPVALYVREKKPESMRERWKREKRESDAAAPSPADARMEFVERVMGMFEAWPKGEPGPTDEPESHYRFGYNTALEDVLTALDVGSPTRRAASANETGAEGAAIELLRKFMEYRDSDYVPNVLFDCARTIIDNAMAAAAPADERASGMPDEVRDSMMDSQYLAGVTAGWNAANADDPNAALKKIHDAYSGYLNPLRDWQKAGRPGAPATPAMADERAECIAWANANGFPKYHESMCAAWEERARRAAASPAAEAVTITDAEAEMLVGIKKFHTHDFGRGPELHADAITDAYKRGRAAAPQPAQADAPVRIEALRKGLFNARDALRTIYEHGVTRNTPIWQWIEDANCVLNGEQADAPAEAREPIAWVTDDDRAITAAQKQRALADGGATASSVRPYSIPCYAVSAPADAGEARLTDAARDMLAERRRQVEAEGWTPEHDDQYQHGAIALAAACYAANAGGVAWADPLPSFWPWMHNWWKPTTPRRDLVKAGALILAELERLDRAALLNGADHDQ
ncbi:hypothetical protein ACOMWV_00520 [Burkholderia pseudomallei]